MIFPSNKKTHDVRTALICNMDEAIEYGIHFIENSITKLDILTESNGPIIVLKNKTFKDSYISAKRRGVKIRFLTEINKDNIQHCKELAKIVDNIMHLEGVKGSICISDSEFLGMTSWKESELINPIIYSNEKEMIEHQMYIFETFWKNSEPYLKKITEIENGIDNEIMKTTLSPLDVQDIVNKLLEAATEEILVFMSTPRAFHRQVKSGAFDILKKIISNNQSIRVRILTPRDKMIENMVGNLTKESNIEIRFIDPISKISILVIDKKFSLVAETKDDEKFNIPQAIGFVTYSNSKPTVLSYVGIFDTLWNQTNLYQQLQDVHEKLKIHDRAQKDFIDIVSHELRTPLTPIIGLTEYVKKETRDPLHKKYLEVVLNDAKKLVSLNERILDLTKFESRLFKPKQSIFDINNLIIDIITPLEQFIKKKSIDMQFKYQINDLCLVYADKNRIGQVLSNLIDNSIKALMETKNNEKMILITTKKCHNISDSAFDPSLQLPNNSQDFIVVSIKDTGIGIKNNILPNIFDKFFSKSFQGVGLGLYMSKNIIESHSGKIWVYNNPDGVGSTFAFSLPLKNL